LIAYPLNHRIVGTTGSDGARGELVPMETDPLFIIPLATLTSLTAVFLALASILRMTVLHYFVLALFATLFLSAFFLSMKMLCTYHDAPLKMFNKSYEKRSDDVFQLNECGEYLLNYAAPSIVVAAVGMSDDHQGTSSEETMGLLSKETSSLIASSSASSSSSGLYTTPYSPVVSPRKGLLSSSSSLSSDNEVHRLVELDPQVNHRDDAEGGVMSHDEKINGSFFFSSFDFPSSYYSLSSSEGLSAHVFTIQFWVLFICYVIGVGSGLTVLDNITKIIDSHSASGSDDDVHAALKTNAVALFSAFNAGGRILFGFASDWLTLHVGISRTMILSINCMFMGFAIMIMAYIKLSLINYAIMFTALSYGGFLTLIPTLIADFYGFKYYGSILGLMNFAPMIGTEVFYNLVSSYVYDKNMPKGSLTCFHDSDCFKSTFVILSSCCFAVAILISFTPPISPTVERSMKF
jgi:hypothetical protein